MEWSRTLEHSTTSESSTRLVRPLLGIWRTEIEAYLTEVGQDFRVDVSNQDVSLTRNRLRHHLLPELERDFNPRVRQHLCHLAEQAADCDAVLRYAADRLLASTLLDRSEHVVRLRCDELTQVARSLLREVFVQLWRNQCWPSQAMTFTHWDRLAEFVQTHPPATLHLPGRLTATRRANLLMLERQP